MKPIIVFDIDGVIRDVSGSYRRALADTVEKFTQGNYRPAMEDIDTLKSEGIWNNDWEASWELCLRYWQSQGITPNLDYNELVAFFQSRYRGTNPVDWDGYITTEPLLATKAYFEELTNQEILWGFFSGATRGSAEYVLHQRLGLNNPVLVAMEDAPGKPDPTGLLRVVAELATELTPVIYVGDTVADMYTVTAAKKQENERQWIGVGIIPPHLHSHPEQHQVQLQGAGGTIVLDSVEKLTIEVIKDLLQ
ncbi:MAG: TIGR01548 family HAD-type hydrolase [Gloeocapsa sp. DLM2.Bin57]|nr:MAG: TIGR01548 family HAD-type hydrolase [Gloeocapsa sp. DLM2.Bin57]